MSLYLFISLIGVLSLSNTLITEAIKKTFSNTKPTIVAAVAAAITGWGLGTTLYLIKGISFTPISIATLFWMAPMIWVGSTVGYDKIKEIIKQINKL